MKEIAFNGDPAVKALALARLRSHIAQGTFRYNPAWSDLGGSALGCVIEGSEPEKYAETTGYPLPLVMILDRLVNDLKGGLEVAAEFAEAWLEGTAVGADLSAIVTRTLMFILEDPILVSQSHRSEAVERCRQTVLDLHRRSLAGEEIARQEWRRARSASLEASDSVFDDKLVRAVGLTVEAAAWPGDMRTVLSDTLSARAGLDIKLALAEIGWTDEDENRVLHTMEASEGKQTHLEGLERVFAVLGAEDPAFEVRMRERVKQSAKFSLSNAIVGRFVLDALAKAPAASLSDGPVKAAAVG
jgi:hypothetical protein